MPRKKQTKLAIADLVEQRCRVLGLRLSDLTRRVGFRNQAKGIRRIEALFGGDFQRTQFLIAGLPLALNLPQEVVQAAVEESASQIAAAQEAEYRAAFRPHAIVLTEREIPHQILVAVLTGAMDKKIIYLKPSSQAEGYLKQALERCPDSIPGFGKSTGIVINYTPDRAVRFSLDGEPLEVLSEASKLGQTTVRIGSRLVDPTRARRFLWSDGDLEFLGSAP